MISKILTGKTEKVLSEVTSSFQNLCKAAHDQGMELKIVSGWRSYERQLAIWNAKARGERTVLDHQEKPLDIKTLSPKELVMAILRWSAIPGASRHHWGTDFDIIDAKNLPTPDYQVQLTNIEADTLFFKLHAWLDEIIEQDKSFGFFRPYADDTGGVSPEKWHISYFPIANEYAEKYTLSFFKETVEQSEMELKETVLENIEEIYERFIKPQTPFSTSLSV